MIELCRLCDRTHLVGEACWFAAASRAAADAPASPSPQIRTLGPRPFIDEEVVSASPSTPDGAVWDKAIADASHELQQVERRRAQLKRAIQNFRASKRDGLKWPDVNRLIGQDGD